MSPLCPENGKQYHLQQLGTFWILKIVWATVSSTIILILQPESFDSLNMASTIEEMLPRIYLSNSDIIVSFVWQLGSHVTLFMIEVYSEAILVKYISPVWLTTMGLLIKIFLSMYMHHRSPSWSFLAVHINVNIQILTWKEYFYASQNADLGTCTFIE